MKRLLERIEWPIVWMFAACIGLIFLMGYALQCSGPEGLGWAAYGFSQGMRR